MSVLQKPDVDLADSAAFIDLVLKSDITDVVRLIQHEIDKLEARRNAFQVAEIEQRILGKEIPAALAALREGRQADPQLFKRLAITAQTVSESYLKIIDLDPDEADVGSCSYLAAECRRAAGYARQLYAAAKETQATGEEK